MSVSEGGLTTVSFIRSRMVVPPARKAPPCPAGPIGSTIATASSTLPGAW